MRVNPRKDVEAEETYILGTLGTWLGPIAYLAYLTSPRMPLSDPRPMNPAHRRLPTSRTVPRDAGLMALRAILIPRASDSHNLGTIEIGHVFGIRSIEFIMQWDRAHLNLERGSR